MCYTGKATALSEVDSASRAATAAQADAPDQAAALPDRAQDEDEWEPGQSTKSQKPVKGRAKGAAAKRAKHLKKRNSKATAGVPADCQVGSTRSKK